MKEHLNRLDDAVLQQLLDELEHLPVAHDAFAQAVQNLQIHQVELEQQNRELQEVQQALELSRDSYAELYERAPVGYATLDRVGTIKRINLPGSALLGAERAYTVGASLGRFLQAGQRRALLNHLARVMDTGVSEPLELNLRCDDGSPRVLRLKTDYARPESGEPVCRIAMLDITEEKQAKQKIVTERKFLQTIIDGVVDPILVIQADHQVLMMNDAASQAIGPEASQVNEANCFEVTHRRKHPCQGELYPCAFDDVLKTGRPQKVVHRCPGTNGMVRTVELSMSPLRNDRGDVVGVIEASRDISKHMRLMDELQQRELQLEHLAQHDPLTSLPNRLLFIDRLSQAIHRAHRLRKKVGLLFVDLDRFKKLNDSFGHPSGDQVLKEVALRLSGLFREDDTVARLGGDEFTIVLSPITHPQDAGLVAQKILDVFLKPFQLGHQPLYMTTSVGISIYPDDGDSVDVLVKNADAAMYRAKDQGRNTFQYYTEDMTTLALEHVMLESSLRQAIVNQEFVLHYQPQVDMRSHRAIGIEALVRWDHPDLGLLLPDRFMSMAEETGIIEAIGEWVLNAACSQLSQWRAQGLPSDVAIKVNLSRRQLENSAFVKTVSGVLERNALDAQALTFEVTETMIMVDKERAARTLDGLRSIGVAISIDDFGTGYSSLSYLKSLAVNELKIDKSFVIDMPKDDNDVAITKAVIGLGKSLNLRVIAEGVETEEQASILQHEDCQYAQGYYYCRPAPADQLGLYLARAGEHPS